MTGNLPKAQVSRGNVQYLKELWMAWSRRRAFSVLAPALWNILGVGGESCPQPLGLPKDSQNLALLIGRWGEFHDGGGWEARKKTPSIPFTIVSCPELSRDHL